MTTHTLTAALWLPQRRDEVFSFFADAFNLEAITPPWLRFALVTPAPIVMRTGTLIDYRLQVHGLPLRWQSEITVWDPPFRFVDEQRRGPYRRWIHLHSFAELDGGTLCRDAVQYAVPGGRFINWLLVRRAVTRIFSHRQETVRRLFTARSNPPPASPEASCFPGTTAFASRFAPDLSVG
jgi:ligand-binding SRPBCC domain-containing protein